ncbi:hypothetical protein ABJI51_37065 [Amycolatopsis sp. NEAU-NG30]|uniref:DUF222 domain-containing protein n=1 Tax=Amycolatopsis melonis TaxID=3156488 RepID=A0ABV0LR07_9PSEU
MSQPSDSWKTPEIREAEAALDRSVGRSRQLLKELDKIPLPPPEPLATPERIAALKAAASRPDAPPHLRLVKRKIDAGELTWEDVASGRAFADPEVRALALPQLGEAAEMYQELREGATPEEVLEARTGGRPADPLADQGWTSYPAAPEQPPAPPAPPTPPAPQPPPAPRHRAEPEWEDDDFADPLAEDDTPPPRSSPSHRPRRDGDDDDFFGHSPLG